MSRLAAIAAWLLVLLLALDLIGSPFHAHGHDLGTDGFAPAALHAALTKGDARQDRVEAQEKTGFAHSIAAVVRAPQQPGRWQPVSHASLHGPRRLASTAMAIPAARAGRYAAPGRRAISAGPHLRPEGRAPPPLHV